MTLSIVWFCIVAFFWTGFFILEGFDFGVGALHKIVGRTDIERRAAINTIGPVWDGNEVWLVVAGAAMFAAFPNWYASWFSALYIALWLVLAALIIRGVSFEFRGKFDRPGWRATWSWTLTVGSVLAPLLFGIGLGDLLTGLPIDSTGDFTGSFLDLLTPYGLFYGFTLLLLCLLHGSTFLSIRSTGVVLERSQGIARRLAIPAAVLIVGYVVWTYALARPGIGGTIALAVPLVGIVVAVPLLLGGKAGGRAFAATLVSIGGLLASLFANLYPNLLISTTDPANTLTVANSTASSYSLQVMSIVAAVMIPLVLLYQGWTYYVFRARVRTPPEPASARSAPAH
ncbi:MAG: cytochrome d ubiquinol oxidase subunit II [Nakamurella sp.]